MIAITLTAEEARVVLDCLENSPLEDDDGAVADAVYVRIEKALEEDHE